MEKNGIITGYEVGASKYDNIQDLEKVRRVERGPDQFRNLFKDLDFNTKYAVEVAAKTSVGAGKEVRELTTTIGAAGEWMNNFMNVSNFPACCSEVC